MSSRLMISFAVTLCFLLLQELLAWTILERSISRRTWWTQSCGPVAAALFTSTVLAPKASVAVASQEDPQSTLTRFRTKAVAEYTNSITASRDTNVSPAEAYDSIRTYIPKNTGDSDASPIRALDVGAGAGLSTQVLVEQLGYAVTDAVDWSADAWNLNVLEQPETVRFFELSDEAFFAQLSKTEPTTRYNVIVYNFAINSNKAVAVAKKWLTVNDGILFCPCNDVTDYWYKQTYLVLNSQGQVIRKSGADVGAWSVQFQPDVTSSTCTGIWCGAFNGFQQKEASRIKTY